MQASLAKESAHDMIRHKGLPSRRVLEFLVMGLPAHSLGLGCVGGCVARLKVMQKKRPD